MQNLCDNNSIMNSKKMVKLKRNICIVVYNVFDEDVCIISKFTPLFFTIQFYLVMKRILNVFSNKFVVQSLKLKHCIYISLDIQTIAVDSRR